MTIMWKSNSEKQPRTDNKSDAASFRKHDESMRKFHLTHPKVETKELKSANTIDWLVLFPIQKVQLTKYSSN